MFLNRRQFTALAAATAGIDVVRACVATKYNAIAFDGFPIVDARPILAKAEESFPGKGRS
jgi:2-haloacid dehalogenase